MNNIDQSDLSKYAVSELIRIGEEISHRLQYLFNQNVITYHDRDLIQASIQLGRESVLRNLEASNIRPQQRELLVQSLLKRYEADLMEIVNQIQRNAEQKSMQEQEQNIMRQLQYHLKESINQFSEAHQLSPEFRQSVTTLVLTSITGARLLTDVKRAASGISLKILNRKKV